MAHRHPLNPIEDLAANNTDMNENRQFLIEAAGDARLGPVRLAASREASRIVDEIIGPGMRVEGDKVIIGSDAIHRLAHALDRIAEHGFEGI